MPKNASKYDVSLVNFDEPGRVPRVLGIFDESFQRTLIRWRKRGRLSVFRRARHSILTVSVAFAILAVTLGGSAPASPQRSAASSSAPQHGGDVTEAVGSSFSGWIPDDAVLADDVNILPAVYGNLVFISNDGKGIVPMLAKSLDFDAAAKTLTVHLQPNAKFSNGQPVTSTRRRVLGEPVESWPELRRARQLDPIR